eukprot:2046871-Alexandrium_andersonii.AAC.1
MSQSGAAGLGIQLCLMRTAWMQHPPIHSSSGHRARALPSRRLSGLALCCTARLPGGAGSPNSPSRQSWARLV